MLSSAKSKSELRLVSVSCNYNKVFVRKSYQLDLGAKMLGFDVMSNSKVLNLHLEVLVLLKLIEAISTFKHALVHDPR